MQVTCHTHTLTCFRPPSFRSRDPSKTWTPTLRCVTTFGYRRERESEIPYVTGHESVSEQWINNWSSLAYTMHVLLVHIMTVSKRLLAPTYSSVSLPFNGHRRLFLAESKRLGCIRDQWVPSNAEVNNEWSYTSSVRKDSSTFWFYWTLYKPPKISQELSTEFRRTADCHPSVPL